MQIPLNEQVVLITGAAGRIGSAVAKRLHREGASLILNDINAESLAELENSFNQQRPSSCFSIPIDITLEKGINEVLIVASRHYPRVHSAFHSAYPHSKSWGTRIENLEANALFEDLSMQLGGAC